MLSFFYLVTKCILVFSPHIVMLSFFFFLSFSISLQRFSLLNFSYLVCLPTFHLLQKSRCATGCCAQMLEFTLHCSPYYIPCHSNTYYHFHIHLGTYDPSPLLPPNDRSFFSFCLYEILSSFQMV